MKADELAAPSGGSFKFENVGDTVEGEVVYVGDWLTQTNKFNGNVEQVCKIGIDNGGGEPVYVWPRKGSPQAQAIANALRDAGLGELTEGQTLKLQYSEDVDTGKPQPMKQYRARVTAASPETAARQAAQAEPF